MVGNLNGANASSSDRAGIENIITDLKDGKRLANCPFQINLI